MLLIVINTRHRWRYFHYCARNHSIIRNIPRVGLYTMDATEQIDCETDLNLEGAMSLQGSLSVLVTTLAWIAASMPARAQEAAAYQTQFDNGGGWDFSNFYDVSWGVDATPIAGNSAENSLNYNNGLNYDYDDFVYGLAISPVIDISGASTATLRFQCRYQTEAIGRPEPEFDLRFLIILDSAGEVLAFLSFLENDDADQACGAMDEWHEHEIPLDSSWDSIQLAFYFDSIDWIANEYQGWFIDDLVVAVPDVTPPAAVTNLVADSPTISSMRLTWTAPTDNDISGAVGSFDLRYSTASITAQNFGSAIPVTGEPNPGVGGTSHQMIVTGLMSAKTYYFALRSTDKAGNVSALSNVASAATTGGPVQHPITNGTDSTGEKDNFAACSAGVSAMPMGVVLVGILILTALVGRKLYVASR
jgi:hypothetical protein